MASVVRLTLVLDLAEVVPVAEHPLNLRDPYRCGGARCGRPGAKPPVGEFGSDVIEGVLAGGIELERQLDERRALGVHRDGADLTAVDPFQSVEIADRCSAERAAVLRLLTHLVRDVGAVGCRSVLIEGRQDAVHQLPLRGVVDLFCRRDEGDPSLLKVGHDDRIVEAVASEPAELVDDDIVDVAFAANAFQHLLERNALCHLGAGPAGFDVLADDGQAELVGLAGARDPLRRNGNALWVVVGVHLSFG
nr:hypothetical protein [Agromyces aurantiacus]